MDIFTVLAVLVLASGLVSSQSSPGKYEPLITLHSELANLNSRLYYSSDATIYNGYVVVVGLSGSGKSTVVNFAAHVPLKSSFGSSGYTLEVKRIDDTTPPCCYIGSNYSSSTRIPFILQNMVDMPGFDDNRGALAEIRNSYILRKFMVENMLLKFLVCIPQYYLEPFQRSERMGKLLSHLEPLIYLNSLVKFEKMINVVVTSATNTSVEATKFIFARMLVESPNLSDGSKKILAIWSTENFNRIMYLKRPDTVRDFTADDYRQQVLANHSEFVSNVHFNPMRSLEVCSYEKYIQSQLKYDLSVLLNNFLVLVQSNTHNAVLSELYGSTGYIRSQILVDLIQLRNIQMSICWGSMNETTPPLVTLLSKLSQRFILDGDADNNKRDVRSIIERVEVVCRACMALVWLTYHEEQKEGCTTTLNSKLRLYNNAAWQSLVEHIRRMALSPHTTSSTTQSGAEFIELKGNIVGVSDIGAHLRNRSGHTECTVEDTQSSQLVIVHVFAKVFFLFDEDISLFGGSIALFSRWCLLNENHSVNLSAHARERCVGKDGQPGQPGTAGGDFYCTCAAFKQQELFTKGKSSSLNMVVNSYTEKTSLSIVSTGGQGGKGCSGSAGLDGSNGSQGVLDYTNGYAMRDFYLHDTHTGIFASTYVYRSGHFGRAGQDGSLGGQGGFGGLAGKISFPNFHAADTDASEKWRGLPVSASGARGRDGDSGSGGRGGIGGFHKIVYEQHVYVTSKYLYNGLLVGVLLLCLIGLRVLVKKFYPTTFCGLSMIIPAQLATHSILRFNDKLSLLSFLGGFSGVVVLISKFLIVDRLASEDVEWTGFFASQPYPVECNLYKAPDGRSGLCCLCWPDGEGLPVVSTEAMRFIRKNIILDEDSLYE